MFIERRLNRDLVHTSATLVCTFRPRNMGIRGDFLTSWYVRVIALLACYACFEGLQTLNRCERRRLWKMGHNILEPTKGVAFLNSGFKSDPTKLFPSIVLVIAG
jgi:hypothetical protein